MQKILLEHWKGGYEKKSNSREVVLFKNKTERQVQGEIWNMSEKGDPSFLFCWEFFCMFSCPLTCPSTPQNLAHYLLISWESKNRLSIAASQELLFSWSSFHWELEWRAFGLSPYRENSGLGAAQLAWDRALCCWWSLCGDRSAWFFTFLGSCILMAGSSGRCCCYGNWLCFKTIHVAVQGWKYLQSWLFRGTPSSHTSVTCCLLFSRFPGLWAAFLSTPSALWHPPWFRILTGVNSWPLA